MNNREEQLLQRLREATRALRTTLDQRDALAKERTEPIAIVGIGCRLPGGAHSPAAFWDLLTAGRDAVVPLQSRWAQLGAQPDESLPRWAALLTAAIDEFEPAFFGIAPREARCMDPQQRLLLEVAWEALEDAGIPPLSLKNSRTGVFFGACTDDYSTLVEAQPAAEKDAYSTTGNMLSILTGRLSYTLGLQGPCFTIDTACSSSLVAIHLACRSLRSRESELALAGGVNLILSLDSTTGLSRLQALSPDGRCRTFDAMANGYVRGEGCGVLVLKRLSDAQREGERIWAVIRGSAINQDGRSTGLTAPNVLAQQELLTEALRDGAVEAQEIGYVETHGTGTSLGDPIEVQALKEVLGRPRADGGKCVLGAVKTNIGHLEGAAGVAGVIKAALVLAKQKIPPNLHLRTLNAHIELEGSALVLATEAQQWARGDKRRCAGVSGFGLSGTNAHLVLEEAPLGDSKPAPARSAELVVLSGRTEAALPAQAGRLRQHLEAHPEDALGDLAYSLARTRSPLDHRLAIVATSREDLLLRLDGAAQGQLAAGAARGTAAASGKLAFLFTGQGAQVPAMGRGLYESWPVFRDAFDRCAALFAPTLPRPLRAVMWAEPGSPEAALLDQTGYTQPALFVLEYALSELWRSFGVLPELVAGHSVGELVAACVAGVFTLSDAVRLCAARAQLMQALPGGGAMVSLAASEAEVAAAVAPHRQAVSIAAVNSAEQVVISGEQAVVMAVAAALARRGVRSKALPVSQAFHSPLMEPMLGSLREVAQTLAYARPRLPLVSNLTGELVTDELCRPEYWVQQVRQPVRFAACVKALQAAGAQTFVELGPKPTLLGLISAGGALKLLPSLRGASKESASLLEALGGLWTQGAALDWRGVFPSGGRRLALPSYAWQRQRCWVVPPAEPVKAATAEPEAGRVPRGGHPLLGAAQRLSTQPGTLLWDTALHSKQPAWLADHRLLRAVVFPGAGHLELALTAGLEAFGAAPFAIRELELPEALVLPASGSVPVQVETSQEHSGRLRFQVASRQLVRGRPAFRVHARAILERGDGQPRRRLDLPALRARLHDAQEAAGFYASMHAMGVELGPAFQGLRQLWQGEGEALGRVLLPEAAGPDAGYQFHPALLDACLQVMAGCFASEREDTPWVPVQVGALRLLQRPVGELYCHVQALAADAASPGKRRAELCVADGTGAVVAEIGGLVVQRLAGAGRSEQDDWYLAVHWEAAAVASAKLSAGRWLLLGRGQGFAESLRAALGQAGHAVAQAAAVPRHREAVRELLSSAFPGSVPTAIVHLESLEEEAAPAGDELPLSVQRLSESVLRTVQALVGQGYREVPRLWLLTRGAQAVDVEAVAVAQAPLLGLGRTLALEHPELRCARLDLDPGRPGDECAAVLAELLADTAEEEIALRSRRRLVSRLVRRAPQRGPREQWEPAKGRSLRLELDAAGVLDQLVLRATARRPPGPGEVELAVEAAGLNFRDVLLALGAIPSEQGSGGAAALQLGSECAGRILAVGPGVQGLAAGDAVMAVAPGCFASHLTCPAALVLPTPAGMSSEQAAAIPVAFLTAYYALSKLAQLGSAERLLIHAATGGVGLAAIQWAQHVGAQVYATAGSPEKRAYLESLGVRHHSDSRSDQFVEDIRGWTAGEGVDVILNSLSGELIPKSLELLRDQGRFIELGKRDYYENAQLGMRPFLRNLTFSLLDLSGLLRRQPARMRQVLQEILQLFAAGVFRLPPLVRVGLDRAADAFRTMAQAQHLGKIVLTAAAADARIRVPVGDKVTIRQDSSYLISGGLGGLGLSVASWLAEQGAGQLVLLSRRGIQSAAQEAAVAALRARGSRVRVAQADVADRAAVAALLREVSDSGQALRGVVHAAGVVDDAVLLQQRPEKFAHVLRPKVQGGWNLHELTRELPLDFFVMYSSAAGLLGSPGQANYAAANTFLDALAHHRRFEGLPGLSIDWGVFGEVGLAAADSGRAARLALRGMRSLLPAQGLQALRELLGTGEAQVAVAPLNLRQWGAFYQVAAASPRLSALRSEAGGSAAAGRDHELLARLGAAPAAARAALIAEYLRAQVAQVLRTPEAELDVSAPLTSLGLDSLMGLELRNHIESALGLRLPATLLWTYPTLAALCQHISGELFPAADFAAPPSSEVDLATGSELETAPLDDSQLLTLLDDELALARKSGA